MTAVGQARAAADDAKAAFLSDVGAVKARLRPARVADDVSQRLRARGEAAASVAAETVRTKPVLAGGILGAALLFMFRAPLARRLRSRDDGSATTPLPASFNADGDATPPEGMTG